MIKHGQEPYLECSSKGDKRFSAFYAYIKAAKGKSIEELYQAAKVFSDGSTGLTWRQAKGKKAVNQEECTEYYKALWTYWLFSENLHLHQVLKDASGLSDIFGQKGRCCQATVLWELRNVRKRDTEKALEEASNVIRKMHKTN